ncbi:chloramphenicol acetyltransferase [Clostridium sp. 'White wine YQ']|uniref:chloramphenicol acetyltransferase n=1 Tax=Clostridium sp. 'White wine YQ' TaxID=3027474 RepID=UPI0023668217|nr:chloramphenicol acetyltransferase [Clostridium sp. 'White wine YQ']MDD7793505.1 chloramphenicol acetyltransferase [Clostridium sp. 'White wine YQ']
MKFIDMDNWKRKDHYKFFKEFEYPHFNIGGNVDITKFYKYIKENKLPFFVSTLYAVSKAANNIKEFRFRIREDRVIEHEVVHPSFTVLADEELFGFCTSNFIDDFKDFKSNTLKDINDVKNNVIIKNEPGRDDLLYTTCIPWISFTNIIHPLHMNPVDSIPRIAWGKYFEEGGKIKMPISVQLHHALADGIHIGKYFNILQEILDNPSKYL